MALTDDTKPALPLSTSDAGAITAYHRGVAALVAGAPGARRLLEQSVALDPGFFLAAVAAAAAGVVAGQSYAAPAPIRPITRAERHHAEIVGAFCCGDRDRAADLRREHLLDYPADLLVVWAPVLSDRSAS